MNWHNFIDLETYPIHNPQNGIRAHLVTRCRYELSNYGVAVVPHFLTQPMIQALCLEAESLRSRAFRNRVVGNPYLEEEDTSFQKDHPKRMKASTLLGVVAYDQFDEDSLYRKLFLYENLLDFIRQVINKEALFRYSCPLGSLNLAIMEKGDHLRWHFDQSDFVVSINLQESEAGGKYEYVHHLIGPDRPNYDGVKQVLVGDHANVKQLTAPQGSLIIFEGRYTMHRVTEILGDSPRLSILFGFADRPNVTSSPHLRQIRYGRTQ